MNEKVSQHDDIDDLYSDVIPLADMDQQQSTHFHRYKEVYLVFGLVGGLALGAGILVGGVLGARGAKAIFDESSVVLDATDGILYANPMQAAHRLDADPKGVTSLISHASHGTVNGHKLAKVAAHTS
ncbi:membrane protein [Gordonia phage Avazak]|uniref:Membrane protein n=1 Tax=Gordonia phage Avazak TaxID=2656529 RepID=A0A649V7W7_9CAUD|nr:membrane protein [Gordonia phage Avazak]QGJ88062.1 membrane protein [Gordonia phage Avazak]